MESQKQLKKNLVGKSAGIAEGIFQKKNLEETLGRISEANPAGSVRKLFDEFLKNSMKELLS